jgi:hypothetical protein
MEEHPESHMAELKRRGAQPYADWEEGLLTLRVTRHRPDGSTETLFFEGDNLNDLARQALHDLGPERPQQ